MLHRSIAIPLTSSALAILWANPRALRYCLMAIIKCLQTKEARWFSIGLPFEGGGYLLSHLV